MYKKKNKGITIVSLIIMIILLLLLVGISIQSITNTGMFEGSSQMKKSVKRPYIENWLRQKLNEAQSETNITDTTDTTDTSTKSEDIIKATRQKICDNIEELKTMGRNVKIEETSTEEDGEKVEIYFYVIVDGDMYKVSLMENGFVGEKGELLPILQFKSITETDNSITVQIMTKRNEGGKLKYYIKKEDELEYTLKETTTEATYTFTGLEPNNIYRIKVVAVAKNKLAAHITHDIELKSTLEQN